MSRPESDTDPSPPRAMCYRCFRPERLCYCDALDRVDNRTRILIIQHPREKLHPLGTARIVARSLSNCELMIAHRQALSSIDSPEVLSPGTALLYPGPDAADLSTATPGAFHTLVILDGTWHHARTLFRDIQQLHGLPRYAFLPERPTEYRVRREPKREYVSTVEAVTHALKVLEPATPGLETMLSSFRKLIDLHLSATVGAPRTPRRKSRKPWRASKESPLREPASS